MSFWDNEGFMAALGGATYGGAQVGSNGRVADWLSAMAYGSGKGLEQYRAAKEAAAKQAELDKQREEDRAFQMEERRMRLQAAQDKIAEDQRRNAALAIQDSDARERAQNPYFVDPNAPPSPGSFSEPGQEAQFWAKRQEAEAKLQAEQQKHKTAMQIISKAGERPTGDAEYDVPWAKSLLKGKDEGLSPTEALNQKKFDWQMEKDARDHPLTPDQLAAEKEWTDWAKEYSVNQRIAASSLEKGATAEEIAAEARALTEKLYGPEPMKPPGATSKRIGTGRTGRIAMPAFAGNLPTATAKTSPPTGPTAPPKLGSPGMKDKLAKVDTAINTTFANLPPELRAQLKAKVMEAVYRGGMTLEQAMAQARQAAYGTPFYQ